jgi:hypothetical protein
MLTAGFSDLCSCQKLAPGSAVSMSSEKKSRSRHNRKEELEQRRRSKPDWTPQRAWHEETDDGHDYGGRQGQHQGQTQQHHGQQQQNHGQQQQHIGQQHYGSKDYARGIQPGYDLNPPAKGNFGHDVSLINYPVMEVV